MISNQQNPTSQKPPRNHITTQSYHNIMTIKLLQKTQKCLIYECQLISTQQKTTIKLINMSHIHMIYNPKLLTQEICVRPDYEYLAFFQLTCDDRFRRFLFQVCLMKVQEDMEGSGDRRGDCRRYLYGADGVLYSNFIIYSKPYERQLQQILQRQKRTLSQLQRTKLHNQLSNLHYQQLTYKNLSSASIVFIPDSEGMNKRKLSTQDLADYQMIFTPVLKINNNIQPILTITKDVVEIDKIYQGQLELLRQIMQLKFQTNQSQSVIHSPSQLKKISNISMHLQSLTNRASQKQSISYAAFASLQKILQIPKLYMLIQQTTTIQKFQQEVQKIRKTKLNQTQLQWYLAKYLQITHMNNNGNITPTPISNFGRNNQSPINMRNDYQNTMSKSWNTTNNMYNVVSACNLANLGNAGNQELQVLVKEYKNLTEDRYRPSVDNQGALGWGDLTIRYHYSTINSNHAAYVKSLQRYTKQLYKQINFKKCRKVYHFYTSKLLQTQHKYNQSILHLKQAYKQINLSKAQQITQNYYNSEKNRKCQLAVVCHQLGRLHVEIKRYKQAIKWYDQCLKVKEDVYGRCSIQMLGTLYNVLYVLIHYQVDQPKHIINIVDQRLQNVEQDASNKLHHLLPYYLHLLSQTKQRISNQQQLAEWTDSLTIRQEPSINLITVIQQKLADLYDDPWRDQLMGLFAGKIGKYRSSGKGQKVLGGSSQVEQMRKVDDISANGEASHRNQQQVVRWACTQILAINHSNMDEATYQQCQTTLKSLSQYTSICLQPQTFYLLYTLQQHLTIISTYLQQKTSKQQTTNTKSLIVLLECINNLKNLYRYMKQKCNNNNIDLQQLKQGVVDMIYGFYGVVHNTNKQQQIDQKWILSEYYKYGCPQSNRITNRRQQSIKHILQYCLLMHKYYKDYGRIYNCLLNSKPIKVKKTESAWSTQSSYIVYHYLLAICLIQMHRYGQTILSINSILSINKEINNNTTKQTQIIQLYQLRPKRMIYKYELIYMALHCHYKMRNHQKFIQLFQAQQLSTIAINKQLRNNMNNNPLDLVMLEQNKCIIQMAIIVYQQYTNQQGTECMIMNLLSLSSSSYQYPNKMLLKILLNSPTQLLQYIRNILNPNNNIKHNQSTDKQTNHHIPNQYNIILDILQQNNKQQFTDIRRFYQQAINVLIDLYKGRQQIWYQICEVVEMLLDCIFGGVQGGEVGSDEELQVQWGKLLPLQICNRTIQFTILLTNKISTTNTPQQQSHISTTLFTKISNKYFPIIIQALQYYHTHNHNHNHHHHHHNSTHQHKSTHTSVSIFNHRYKLQILQIFQTMIWWLRSNFMFREVVFCRIFLYACGRGMGVGDFGGQDGWGEEIGEVCNILGLSAIQQIQSTQSPSNNTQKIIIPPIFHKLHLHKYLKALIQNMEQISHECHEYRQAYALFINSLTTTNGSDTDIDQHLENIENLLLSLEGLRLNLGNLLPNRYMEGISQGVLTQIREKLEMS